MGDMIRADEALALSSEGKDTSYSDCKLPSDPSVIRTTLEEFAVETFQLSLQRPCDWKAIELPLFDHKHQGGPIRAWSSEDESENIICGCGVLPAGVTLEAMALAPAITMQRAGVIKIDTLVPLPVNREDGLNAFSVNFCARTSDGKDFFKNTLLLERDGYWFSMEATLLGENRREDLPNFVSFSSALLGSLQLQ